MDKVSIKVKKTGKRYGHTFVLKDFYGKGEHAYNPMWYGGMYKKKDIIILKNK